MAELITRSNIATVEVNFNQVIPFYNLEFFITVPSQAALLNDEVTIQATNFRKQFAKDSKLFQATSAALVEKIVELSSLLEKKSANFKCKEEDMRLGFTAERLKLIEVGVTEVFLEVASK